MINKAHLLPKTDKVGQIQDDSAYSFHSVGMSAHSFILNSVRTNVANKETVNNRLNGHYCLAGDCRVRSNFQFKMVELSLG